MSKIVEFVQNCVELPLGDDFGFFIENSINNLSAANFKKEEKELKEYLEKVNKNGSIGTIAVGIKNVINIAKTKNKKLHHQLKIQIYYLFALFYTIYYKP